MNFIALVSADRSPTGAKAPEDRYKITRANAARLYGFEI
jgi:hypothetical protein